MVPDQIIFATDFSPASLAARSIAVTMAKLFHCRIQIVHVFEYVARHPYRIPVEWMIGMIRTDAERQLLEVHQAITMLGVEATTLLVEDGIPEKEILNCAKSYKSPMIVIGTHAIGGMDRFLLGSTAEYVLREADCPVVTVGPHVQPVSATGSFRQLLFATDFRPDSLKAAPFVATLREATPCKLAVLNVQRSDQLPVATTLFDPLRLILDRLGASHTYPETEYLTLHGDAVAQAISNEAERLPADLLVLGVKRASAFITHLAPKVAFQVIAAAPCAVLTISS
ncbi:universal stress protein UspA-like protein [Terriglobus roseus DSM 18391]|uniref:Universal stress protein UspA-like protein n=1 Tax=Terriglobus roseus (strain DSM 18391 / NRRL B-41598 / KBS 63) TaxID=926566 RepID=I3ZDV7_TERRK|nr:universal stress protein [Terriglobus roseus]AFL87425.1 universal stress protein UspA-like protein [Terriglobus roseus DSM 18391]